MPIDRLESIDVELAQAARSGGALRLYLGVGLKALEARSGHKEMGFPSIEAYAHERCGRSARWVQESRKLAVALNGLPLIRRSLIAGRIGWSMAALVARHARAEDELVWAEEAERRALRTMRWLVSGPREPFVEASEDDLDVESSEALDAPRTLTVTVDREDAWLYECARMVVGRLSGQYVTHDDVVTALVAEGGTSLQEFVPGEAEAALQREEEADRVREAAARAWRVQLARWREEAEERCERGLRVRAAANGVMRQAANGAAANGADGVMRPMDGGVMRPTADGTPSVADGAAEMCRAEKWEFDGGIQDIDAQLREIADQLATRELVIGRLAEAFWKADGWRRLGYASAEHYTRERLGVCLASLDDKRRLARQLETMPALEAALKARALGYESVRLVAKVATPETVDQWIARSEERTVQHLRQETDIAGMAARLSNDSAPAPPTDDRVARFHSVEGRIISGVAFAEIVRASGVMDGASASKSAATDGATDLPVEHQISAPPTGAADISAGDPVATVRTVARGARDETEAVGSRRGHQISASAARAAGTTDVDTAASESTTPGHQISASAEVRVAPRRASPSTVAGVLAGLLGELDLTESPAGRALRSRGRVTLKLRVHGTTYRDYRRLERRFLWFGPGGMNFVRFLCSNLIDTWKHALYRDVAFGDIYVRDGYRCTNPVCGCRHVTPHHLRYRSQGVDHSPENVASVCLICHLEGIHGGWLKALPPASKISWAIGRVPHTWVHGRKKIRDHLPEVTAELLASRSRGGRA